MQMNVLASAVLFLFIGPFDRASSWETGESYLFIWIIALFAALAGFGMASYPWAKELRAQKRKRKFLLFPPLLMRVNLTHRSSIRFRI